jgi:hypothetical protein
MGEKTPETETIRPSPLQNKNLAILHVARAGYFTHKGLYPYLLSTFFFYIVEKARLPLAQNLLPLINDENNRKILERAISKQGDWEPLEPFKSSWTFFRKAGIGSLKNQQIEDLLQLDYYRLLEEVNVPNEANLSLFWGGLVDFLINSWSILQEFCLVIEVKNRIEEQNKIREKEAPQKQDKSGPKAIPLVAWADMQLEHHLINILLRLRAGWDKLADYLVAPYYGVTTARKWDARINKLDREIQPLLNGKQSMFWTNWLENAKAISKGVKEARDLELHKIAMRARETLGNPGYTYSLNELENFVLFEHFRLQESFLLILAMIRSA